MFSACGSDLVFVRNANSFSMMVYLMQKVPEFWKVFAFTFPILYFGHKGVNTDRAWPNDMARALACMALGTLAYLCAEFWQSKTLKENTKNYFKWNRNL